jgi:hypothetical protein
MTARTIRTAVVAVLAAAAFEAGGSSLQSSPAAAQHGSVLSAANSVLLGP